MTVAKKNTGRHFQEVGDGVYRVVGTVRRSAKTGRYVKRSSTSRNAGNKSSRNT